MNFFMYRSILCSLWIKITYYEYFYYPITTAEYIPWDIDQWRNSSLTLAIYADSGNTNISKQVFKMAKQYSNIVLHAGDFSYLVNGAKDFGATLMDIFGDQFPYITTLGDHDLSTYMFITKLVKLAEETTYRNFFVKWNRNVDGLECEGVWGEASVCRYHGVVFIGLGLMFKQSRYTEFLNKELKKYQDWPIKFCFWHRVDEKLQPGWKTDSTVIWIIFILNHRDVTFMKSVEGMELL